MSRPGACTLAIAALLTTAPGCGSKRNPAFQVGGLDAPADGPARADAAEVAPPLLDGPAAEPGPVEAGTAPDEAAPDSAPADSAAADLADVPVVDAGPEAMADLAPDLAPPLFVDCPAVDDLAACVRFETPGKDESRNNLAVTATGVRYAMGMDGQAVFLTSSSRVQLADSPQLVSPSITLEAWVRPDSLPTGDDRAALIDYSRQYALVIEAGGRLRCRVNTGGSSYEDLSEAGAVRVGVWTAVACTAHAGTLGLWVNGVRVANNGLDGPLVARNTTEPFLIGSNFPTSANPDTDPFVGGIDNVRVWRRLRTNEELCRSAPGCTP